MNPAKLITLSVVSHNSGSQLAGLISDINLLKLKYFDVILTINIPEDETYLTGYSGPSLRIIRNGKPRGFGENHNRAFGHSRTPYFVVLNPDIRLLTLNWNALITQMQPGIAACSPAVVNEHGTIQDNARRDPTLYRIGKRYFRGSSMDYPIHAGETAVEVDWLAGMFIMFDSNTFRNVGGFDERYRLYLEDADICRNIRTHSEKIIICPSELVLHVAQRDSHKKAKYFIWHLSSLIKYLLKFRGN